LNYQKKVASINDQEESRAVLSEVPRYYEHMMIVTKRIGESIAHSL